jgi:hypothetical protein
MWAGDSTPTAHQDTRVPYDAKMSAKIEKAFKAGQKTLKIDAERFLDFADMTQKRFDDKSKRRSVFRVKSIISSDMVGVEEEEGITNVNVHKGKSKAAAAEPAAEPTAKPAAEPVKKVAQTKQTSSLSSSSATVTVAEYTGRNPLNVLEIRLEVFKYVPGEMIFSVLPMVCKSWHQSVKDLQESFWRFKISLEIPMVSSRHLFNANWLRDHPQPRLYGTWFKSFVQKRKKLELVFARLYPHDSKEVLKPDWYQISEKGDEAWIEALDARRDNMRGLIGVNTISCRIWIILMSGKKVVMMKTIKRHCWTGW